MQSNACFYAIYLADIYLPSVRYKFIAQACGCSKSYVVLQMAATHSKLQREFTIIYYLYQSIILVCFEQNSSNAFVEGTLISDIRS
uniref:Uncharacterized protein n=1 Tax=Pararge aegeria TaxID=116150 RepID=S4P120_9NEOP